MIYRAYNESITLYGADADEFLESVGVELYDDFMTINEMSVDGPTGESMLNENGIFLYEDGIVLEGDQAEAYKARKAKEQEDKDKKEKERYQKRYTPTGMFYGNPGDKDRRYEKDGERFKQTPAVISPTYASKSDVERSMKALNINRKELNKRASNIFNSNNRDDYVKADNHYKNYSRNAEAANDATNRHIRRHPKQYKEAAIFNVDII